MSAWVPVGFQLIPWIWRVLGLVTRVRVVPSYLRRSPEPPPINANEPSGLQATVFKSSPADMTPVVGICVRVVPFHLMRTALSPAMRAYDPSGFHEIRRRAVVTGWPMRVKVPFWSL